MCKFSSKFDSRRHGWSLQGVSKLLLEKEQVLHITLYFWTYFETPKWNTFISSFLSSDLRWTRICSTNEVNITATMSDDPSRRRKFDHDRWVKNQIERSLNNIRWAFHVSKNKTSKLNMIPSHDDFSLVAIIPQTIVIWSKSPWKTTMNT